MAFFSEVCLFLWFRQEALQDSDDHRERGDDVSLEESFGLLKINDEKSLSYVVQRLKGCYFMTTKKSVLETILKDDLANLRSPQQHRRQQPKISVNRIRAAQVSSCCFFGTVDYPLRHEQNVQFMSRTVSDPVW
jgi:hypothetical protein